jgi:hypothetical protein
MILVTVYEKDLKPDFYLLYLLITDMFLKIVLMFFTTVTAALGKNYLVDTADLPAGGMGLTGMQQSMLFFLL